MNYSIILNRHAGNGNAEKAWSSIKPVLDQQQIDYHMETTKYPNTLPAKSPNLIMRDQQLSLRLVVMVRYIKLLMDL